MKLNVRASQWVGIVVVLAWCALLGWGVPRYAGGTTAASAQVNEVEAGTRVSEGPVSAVPSEGWSQSTEIPGSLLLKKGDVTFVFSAPMDSAGKTPTEAVADTAELIGESFHIEVGDPSPFTTDSGADGAKLVVSSPDGTQVLAAVGDGTVLVSGQMVATTAAWPSISKDVDPMLTSIEIDSSATRSTTEDPS